MKYLLLFSRAIDALNEVVGKVAMWLILLIVLISTANAISRYALHISSNAWLEIQWYLFGAVFLLGAGFAFLRNAHVRIDVVSSRLTARTRNWIDVVGILVFLLPLCYLLITLGWPLFERAWNTGEMSPNAGGLIRWPAYLLIPAGFALLALQAVSELIKRFNFLFCGGPDALAQGASSDVQQLAREIALAEHDRIERDAAAAVLADGGRKS
ncbi:TRAP transporter small permease subunit [Serpentinimonas maccroryi]|uniref:TRAP transporter small permease subunit n=1 Tax=Serpentinimonas maccroryi TaxID=1458426 RepID=UPI00203491FE|nr:TRAP transporter small permease subunit [Serpentinimonas maccroryi]MCM2478149.1 TRAP transporter small permease subunit [Serpentinimonas maccroryi]